MGDMFRLENIQYGDFRVVKIVFYKVKDNLLPKEDLPLLFFSCGDLFTGRYLDGKFYHEGSIYFPEAWAYAPIEPF